MGNFEGLAKKTGMTEADLARAAAKGMLADIISGKHRSAAGDGDLTGYFAEYYRQLHQRLACVTPTEGAGYQMEERARRYLAGPADEVKGGW